MQPEISQSGILDISCKPISLILMKKLKPSLIIISFLHTVNSRIEIYFFLISCASANIYEQETTHVTSEDAAMIPVCA